MVEALVCLALIAGLGAIWIFGWLARLYFRRRQREGRHDDSFLGRVFRENPMGGTAAEDRLNRR